MDNATAAARRVHGTFRRYRPTTTGTTLALTLDPATDGTHRDRKPNPRRQSTRRAATLAAIREAARA